MKSFSVNHFFIIFLLSISILSCSKDKTPEVEADKPITLNNEVNDFIWNGMNEIYLWQSKIPNLSDTRFDNQDEYFTFLNSFDKPETLFDNLLYQKDIVDRFSFLVDDYVALENSFQGTTKSNGLDFSLGRIGNSDDIFGYVRYVANQSNASTKDIKRGDFFMSVNNTQLTINNYQNLLFGENDTYTLGMADINNNSISLNGKNVELTKSDFTENPILINKVIDANGIKVGYLMYNSFIADFDSALNDVFTQFKTDGITELVLDLRYNPGGRVSSAIILSSMITGQFTDEVFSTEVWNSKYQNYFETNNPEYLINRFTDKQLDNSPITSINLSKVYVLTTNGTASASELVINCLDPYIDVVQIGTNTTGKYTASVTLYDSPNYSKDNINTNHKFAIQPLVLKSANKNGVTDYFNGLTPDHIITYNTSSGIANGENIINLGVLGDENEPFLEKALSLIKSETAKISKKSKTSIMLSLNFEDFADSKDFTPTGKGMYTKFKLEK
ncbi:S41 family peptidase [Sabulilitoribacter arenilitoris]|uniref:S41 family peptidase n=1 Tax=Wocania arenilitoris TaxID=2044858 RepID=A0AAE3EN97_9FLAO|nr:S41 family peptidase [Wocania arenilitoris]MCF7568550.1 S41 family peptidase [Wocania arenilitoris]